MKLPKCPTEHCVGKLLPDNDGIDDIRKCILCGYREWLDGTPYKPEPLPMTTMSNQVSLGVDWNENSNCPMG